MAQLPQQPPTMKLPSLYALAQEYIEAGEKMADLDMPDEVIKDTLEGLAGTLEVKATNVAAIVRNFEAMTESIKKAEQLMAARRRILEGRAERLRAYLHANMKQVGMKKIECPYFVLSIKNNPGSVKIAEGATVPDEFMRFPPIPDPVPDLVAIKAAIEAHAEDPETNPPVSFAYIDKGTRLEIK